MDKYFLTELNTKKNGNFKVIQNWRASIIKRFNVKYKTDTIWNEVYGLGNKISEPI